MSNCATPASEQLNLKYHQTVTRFVSPHILALLRNVKAS